MNTPNPLQPQGVVLPRAKSNIYFKVLMILAVHVVVIGGLLLQGCKDTAKDKASATPKDEVTTTTDKTSPMSPSTDFSSPASTSPATTPASTPAPAVPATAATTPPLQPLGTPAMLAPVTATSVTPPLPMSAPTAAPAGAHDYVIAPGDMPSTIAKKNGVSLKALTDANPGMDAKKLQIGHKLQIPAGTGIASTATPMVSDSAPAPGDATTYTVKPGDVLVRIAHAHGTSVKAIQALNEMKTTAIKAGQKLKLPEMKVASAEASPVSSPAISATTPPASTPALPAIRAN